MPNENNDDDLTQLSIEEINDLYSDIIEFPEDVRLSRDTMDTPGVKPTLGCGGGK